MTDLRPPSRQALEGRRIVLVTGSTNGLGRVLATALAEGDAHVIVHGRSLDRGLQVVTEVRRRGRGSACFYEADLASIDSVRAFGQAILRDYDRVDVLVNNAGILLRGGRRKTSSEGYELAFAVNYLSGFLLTHLLLPLVPERPESRIVNVSSGAQTPIDLDDPMMDEGYSGRRGYAQSKLAQILFSIDLAVQLDRTGIRVNSLHPATLMDTDMVRSAGYQPRTSVEEGSVATLNLINSPGIANGQYFDGLRPASADPQAYDAEARAKLRRLSAELTGIGQD